MTITSRQSSSCWQRRIYLAGQYRLALAWYASKVGRHCSRASELVVLHRLSMKELQLDPKKGVFAQKSGPCPEDVPFLSCV